MSGRTMDRLKRRFATVDQLLDHVADTCSFPASAQRLMALVEDESSSVDAIAATLASDPALATQVLRIANSSAFRRVGTESIGDLRHAVIAIGLGALRPMAGAAALLASFATKDELSLDLHARSAVCGSIAAATAAPRAGGTHSVAFVCGLLSEVGALACVAADGAGYLELRQRTLSVNGNWSVGEAIAREGLEVLRYGVSARTIGARLLRRYDLPDEIARAVDAAPRQPPHAPLLHRATAFARIATPLLVAPGRYADDALSDQLREIARQTSLVELTPAELVQRCKAGAAQAERTLRAIRG